MQTTTIEPAVVGGFVGGMLGASLVAIFVFYLLVVIANWKIFQKAGEGGWKSIIPIYNVYIMYKIVAMRKWFWITLGTALATSIVSTILNPQSLSLDMLPSSSAIFITILAIAEIGVIIFANIMYCVRTSKVFGHGAGYALGLFFFPNIFQLILGFGRSKYDKKVLKSWQ